MLRQSTYLIFYMALMFKFKKKKEKKEKNGNIRVTYTCFYSYEKIIINEN